MQHIINDHEEVRQFVAKETGGFVERIEASSTSDYKPTLDSQEEIFAGSNRVFIRFAIKPDATFVPLKYEAQYDVKVVYPPGDRFDELVVCRINEILRIMQVRNHLMRGW